MTDYTTKLEEALRRIRDGKPRVRSAMLRAIAADALADPLDTSPDGLAVVGFGAALRELEDAGLVERGPTQEEAGSEPVNYDDLLSAADYLKRRAAHPDAPVMRFALAIEQLVASLRAGAPRVEAGTSERWIAVEERFPEPNESCWFVAKGKVIEGWYAGNREFWCNGGSTITTLKATHWLPIVMPSSPAALTTRTPGEEKS